ncbi:hypothetical protein ACLMPM_22860 [Yersinia enterocolitica]|uniref:hypothetical protein n=1 Tax=Yersinia TaxID=629 RepID=UPI0005E8712A|nr:MULTISPECIES: hypothetical protein [Yersinia]EKN3387743.1 hypothetical protein [Yersinia enterocolitica]EKN3588972.1 hypothetical protein [Yersinia enterocolitica]EKN3597041.1 hypothetical protein [Yersinia enterocolitica]EKN3769426.1 hypothetical protein [Yersinia enterocolitica]EKN4084551.1 hypothetical protein [Yersinia enterocolitica]
MFYYSHSLIPLEGSDFVSTEEINENDKIIRANKRIKIMQKIGIALLSASFITQGVSIVM